MFEREENFKFVLLEIKRIKQLKAIRSIENTMRELYEIEKELKNKLGKVEALEEKALKEIVNHINTLDEIDIDINLIKRDHLKSPMDTLSEMKLAFKIPFEKTKNRLEGLY